MSGRKWIPRDLKKGALSHQLGIPERERIPTSLLREINAAPRGTYIRNPTRVGNPKIYVTETMKRRALFALNVRK